MFKTVKIFGETMFLRASASRSKNLNDKKYFNTMKIFRANSVFRAISSCSKILSSKKYIFNTVKIFRAKSVFLGKRKLLKYFECKSVLNTVKNFVETLFFRASASCSKNLNDKKYIFNTVKIFRANSVFQDNLKLLKNPEW